VNPAEYAAMEALDGAQWWYAGMRRISRELLAAALHGAATPPRAGLRLLDAGCGTGWNLHALSDIGATFGVDISPLAVAASRRRGGRVVRGSVLSLPFAPESFDVVTSFDVLYHRWVTDDRAAVVELARSLRPGGVLLVRVPALAVLWGAHDEAVHSRHRYTRRELTELLRSAGLEVERATYANSLLFPVLLVRRFIDRLLSRTGSDVAMLPAPLEALFGALLRIEAAGLRFVDWPIGASVFAVARKPGPLSRSSR
jgi:SAM-dependent methyltransferase